MEDILTSRSVTPPTGDENPDFRVDDFVTMIVEAASGPDDLTTSGQLDSVVTVKDQDVSKLFVTWQVININLEFFLQSVPRI